MKLYGHLIKWCRKKYSKCSFFLEVQDGVLSSAGKIVSRMIELKGLSQDVLKKVLIMITTTESLETYRFSCMRCPTLLLTESVCSLITVRVEMRFLTI